MKGGYKIRGDIIYVYGTVDGKHYRLSTGKQATKLNISWIKLNHRDALLQLIDKKKAPKSSDFNTYAIAALEADEYQRKYSTNLLYGKLFNCRIKPYFACYAIDQIKPLDIKQWQSWLLKEGLNPTSVKVARAVLKSVFRNAITDELIQFNPMTNILPPRNFNEVEEITPFTFDEVKVILTNAGKHKLFLTVAFFTGMRIGEIRAFKWDDIDFTAKRIHVRRTIYNGVSGSPKTGKTRIIDMLPIVEQALKEKFKETGLKNSYIFLSYSGEAYARNSAIAKYWKILLKKCGFMHRALYNTRHTFATMMLQSGEDVLWVSKMLGHSNMHTTAKYYIKYIPQENKKRGEFSDSLLQKNCTLTQLRVGIAQ